MEWYSAKDLNNDVLIYEIAVIRDTDGEIDFLDHNDCNGLTDSASGDPNCMSCCDFNIQSKFYGA